MAGVLCLAAAASDPAERLHNPAQEARARTLFRDIRCLVCQNQSIDESEADLAGDLRRIVRGEIAQGRSDAEIRAFLVKRYGEFVLLQPQASPANAVLWLTPFVIVGAGLGALALRRAPPLRQAPLGPGEEARLARVLAAAGETPATVPPHGGLTVDPE